MKTSDEFYRNKRRKNGLGTWCKDCFNEDQSRRYHAMTPEARKARNRRHTMATVEYRRAYNLKKNYGLTLEDFEARVADQGGKCAACGDVFIDRPHVDHDHTCCPQKSQSCGDCLRGLLCVYCNTALGYVFDDPERLTALTTYLKKWSR